MMALETDQHSNTPIDSSEIVVVIHIESGKEMRISKAALVENPDTYKPVEESADAPTTPEDAPAATPDANTQPAAVPETDAATPEGAVTDAATPEDAPTESVPQ